MSSSALRTTAPGLPDPPGSGDAELVPTDAPAKGTLEAIFQGLEGYSLHLIGPARPRLLVIPLHGDDGTVTGGLWGSSIFQWAHVLFLFIPEFRRSRGLGSILMGLAEEEARRRGCIGVQVTTFSFQAVPFYEKLGYKIFGTLEDYPPGHNLVHFSKRIDGPRKDDVVATLDRARAFAAKGEDEAAKQAYVEILKIDSTHFAALNEIGVLALTGGHRAAARTAFAQAARWHPDNPAGHVNLGNLLLEDGDAAGARPHFKAALAADSTCPLAHQGLARTLAELGDPSSGSHWRAGFEGHAVVVKPYRGIGPGTSLLLLVAAHGGNIPTRQWIDDRHFAMTVIHADYHDLDADLPPHALVVNAIGDADLCDEALIRAERLLAGGAAPLINPPALVRATGRAANARRLGAIPGVIAPKIETLSSATLLSANSLEFPLLLRVPGFHTGRHFVRVPDRHALADAVASLPGDRLLAIQYLDARGSDGKARKYRAMFIDGVLYPAHLAISDDWKVHYFTAAMTEHAKHRAEEQRFLEDMPGTLGPGAMTALAAIGTMMGLDYAGVDFALAPDGSVLLFEANATMVVTDPGPDPMWDYRRRAIGDVTAAMRRMLDRRIENVSAPAAPPPPP